MLQLTLQSANGVEGKAEMFIYSEDDSVDITVMTPDDRQFDFTFTGEEWEKIKSFVDKTK